ncbi:unnamed protein product [Didymodactylos carnosus]|uniref:Uncharacterized protein n=1 Tax=Didymodactylos carnosus TaxID=1234261 RepID=A0A814FQU8_9BILA|nr:unnamed protein product [Didymodactylos carnosus]CAF1162136.1 unnamed protein product [Didymodactylos carnosus]CAF3761079.1 unnamed protein product [Didymodactylos carnosus]CAF3973884.1 unnamed protein product [Didymodactylos carnosus]
MAGGTGGRSGRPTEALQSKGRQRRPGFLTLIRGISTGTNRRYQSSAGYDVGFAKASGMLMVIERKSKTKTDGSEAARQHATVSYNDSGSNQKVTKIGFYYIIDVLNFQYLFY